MSTAQLQSIGNTNAHPLSSLELNRLTQAIEGLSAGQLNWASGYLAGVSSVTTAVLVEPEIDRQILTILYASQTGNAHSVAQQLSDKAAAKGLESRLVSTADFKPRDLVKESLLLLVVSTQGEGEVPESAVDLWKYINGRKAPDLGTLQYGVFALGDSSYTHFCKAGLDFDTRLAELGANSLLQRIDADVDFDELSGQWIEQSLEKIEELKPARQAVVLPISPEQTVVRYNRNNPCSVTLIENRRLSTDKALADVRHVVLEIEPGTLEYKPGDSLGVWFKNDPKLIAEILSAINLSADETVTLANESTTLTEILSSKREITLLNPQVVKAWLEQDDTEVAINLLNDSEKLREYAAGHQLLDLIREFPCTIAAQALVDRLKPIQPRLYSIASSQSEFEDEIHLTVSKLCYQANGRACNGAASGFLVDRIFEDDVLDAYVVENSSFRLPESPDTPVIMIGAGTGVAPFRSFLQERSSRGDSGKNWLVFGNRNFHEDFLYQTDWLEHRKNGVLTKVSTAFSRDSEEKVYVQDRIESLGDEFFAWLEEGASVYVCGGMDMEKSISQTLKNIVQKKKDLNEEQAEQYVENLRLEGRYLRDVY